MPQGPNALGNIVDLGDVELPEGSPPTSYAAYAVVKGVTTTSVLSFAGLTALRSLLIAPGLLAVGIRGKQLLYGSLGASAAISSSALVYAYALDKKNAAAPGSPANPIDTIDTTAEPVTT